MGRKSRLKRTPEHNEKLQQKYENREQESRLIRECRAGMADPLVTNVSFRRLSKEEIKQRREAEHARLREEAIRERKHLGDPCEFCGTAHDDVEPGPCPGIQPEEPSTGPLMMGAPYQQGAEL